MEDQKWLYTIAVSTLILLVVTYCVHYLVLQSRRKQQPPLPPGPRSLPVIGHLHLLKNPLHRTFKSFSTKYGPVFGLQLGNQYAVVVSSTAAVEECFGVNDVVLADRPRMSAWKHLDFDNSTMGSTNYGDHWRNLRRISSQELFSVSRQSMSLSLRQEEVKSMIKSLFYSTRSNNGRALQKVEMKSRISELPFNIIVRTLSGKRYYGKGVEDTAEAKEFQEIIRGITDQSAAPNPGDFLPFLRLIDFGDNEKNWLKLKKRIDRVLQGLIDESKAKDGAAAAAAKTMINNILHLQRQTDSASLSDKTIKGLVLELILAGSDTVAVTMEWAMSLLLNNPEKLKKVQSELDGVINPGRLVDEADLPKLTYLQAVINETLRMYPAAPLLAPHYSSGECTIQGFHIPRGTMLFANAWALHRDPQVWDDPLIFKPERFENLEDSHAHAYKFIPFGVGRRSCPGASMAIKVVGLALASLIQCFDWGRIGEEEVDMREGDGITMRKLTPLEAMCQPRNKAMDVLSRL
uniref:Cytochrome P450 n=1 Tax=Kalanchoe fedtschenkoi TaxID=63787 RepID=A0A7N0THZ2_KALFE